MRAGAFPGAITSRWVSYMTCVWSYTWFAIPTAWEEDLCAKAIHTTLSCICRDTRSFTSACLIFGKTSNGLRVIHLAEVNSSFQAYAQDTDFLFWKSKPSSDLKYALPAYMIFQNHSCIEEMKVFTIILKSAGKALTFPSPLER